jgi:hypothetical protein
VKKAFELTTLAIELAALAWYVYKQSHPEAELRELASSALHELEERARYREAIRQTLASIRRLPETEGDQ